MELAQNSKKIVLGFAGILFFEKKISGEIP